MSVVGFDFGNDSCYISVARQGGIETIANDYSMRATPSYVAFSEKQRIMGVSAKSSHMTNVDKTFYGFKNLLGLMCNDPAVTEETSRLPFPISNEPNGTIGFRIDFMGKSKVLTPEQVTASLFTKLKEIAENALNTKINDVVISVPSFFNDSQRRALLDSAKMSGLNVLKLMNETTATALAYGIYKQDLPESDKPARNVIFVDCGHTSTQVAACSFNKGKLTILSSSHELIGGRNYDEALANYFMDDFAGKYKIDVRTNKKAKLKLLTEVEKLKKQMSANTNKMPLNIECFMNDIDVKGVVDRAAFEEMIAPMVKKIEGSLEECLRTSGLKKEEIYSVEVVGGSSRIPCIKDAIERILGKTASTTLNSDEAISRGCALQCAILSPIFKVREFSVTDVQPFPIKLVWGGPNAKKEDSGDMEVFPQFHAVPFSKMLTFYKSEPFTVVGEYAASVPFHNRHIGQFEIGEIRPTAEGGNQKVKVKVRINPNGIFFVSNASLIEKHEVEEEVPVPMEVDPKAATETAPANGAKTDETMDTTDEKKDEDKKPDEAGKEEMKVDEPKNDDAKKDDAPVRMEKRKKIVNKTVDLPVTSIVLGSLMKERLDEAVSIETAMARQDVAEQERLTAKNSVEEYIYEIRGKISDELEEFIVEDDRNKFVLELEDAENWLYEEGEEADKPIYMEKLNKLKGKGEAVRRRRTEFEERPGAINMMGQCLQLAQKAVDAYKEGDEKYTHLEPGEVEKVQKLIQEKGDWYGRVVQELNGLPKTADPSTLASQFVQEKESFWHTVTPILNKPKPKVEPPKQESAPADAASAEPAGEDTAAKKPEGSEDVVIPDAEKDKVNMDNMDVD
jgi:molecular chaperone DnaK (HSP70)